VVDDRIRHAFPLADKVIGFVEREPVGFSSNDSTISIVNWPASFARGAEVEALTSRPVWLFHHVLTIDLWVANSQLIL
jgi:hypothetical protein